MRGGTQETACKSKNATTSQMNGKEESTTYVMLQFLEIIVIMLTVHIF